MADSDGRVVPVEILGQRYSIRTSLDPEYVAQLAAYVDQKIRAASDSAAPTDSLRLAVLAALNVAGVIASSGKAFRTARQMNRTPGSSL